MAKASMRMCVYMYGLGIETKMDVVYLYASTLEYHITSVLGRYPTWPRRRAAGVQVGGPHRGRSSSFSGRELQLTEQG